MWISYWHLVENVYQNLCTLLKWINVVCKRFLGNFDYGLAETDWWESDNQQNSFEYTI